MALEVVDDKGRVILTIGDEGQFACSRFEDMKEQDKEFIIKVSTDLSGKDPEEVRKFLDFEDDNGVFCS